MSKPVFKFYTNNGTKVVVEAEGIVVGKSYRLTGGHYAGKMFTAVWISFNRTIQMKNQKSHPNTAVGRYRQIHGLVVGTKIKINTVSIHLTSQLHIVGDSPLSKLSNKSIVLAAGKGNKKAIQEFVKRFKRMPKINK